MRKRTLGAASMVFTIAAGLLMVSATPANAATPAGMDSLTTVAFYDFGEDTDGSWNTASQVLDGTGTPVLDYMRPGVDSGTATLQSAGSGAAVKLDNAGRIYAPATAGTNYADVGAYGFVATITASFGTTNSTDSINVFQRGVFNTADTNGQLKLQLKSNDDYPQCRFEDDKGDSGTSADSLMLSAPNTLDIVDGNIWTVSCWRDDKNTQSDYSDDVFGITAVDNTGTEYETTAVNGSADISGTVDFNEGASSAINTSGDAFVGSLANTLTGANGDLAIGGKTDVLANTDRAVNLEAYDFSLAVNRAVVTEEPTPHPLDADNIGGWGDYVANWQFAKAASNSSGTDCTKKQIKDGAVDPHKLDLCGSSPLFKESPTAVKFLDGSYANTASFTTANPGAVDFRVQARFDPTSLPTSGNSSVIAQKGSSGDRWRVMLNDDGSVSCNFNDGALNAEATTAASAVSTSGGFYVVNCVIWNGSIYTYLGAVDSGADATDDASGWGAISNSEPVRVARRDATVTTGQTHQFLGEIDYLKIWKEHTA